MWMEKIIDLLKKIGVKILPKPFVTIISKYIYSPYVNTPRKYRGKRYPTSEGKTIIYKAKQHFKEASCVSVTDEMPASDRWATYNKKTHYAINHSVTTQDAIFYAQSQIGYDHRNPAPYWRRFVKSYSDQLSNEFAFLPSHIIELGDSPYSRPKTLLKFHGRLVSNVYYWHMWEFLRCLSHVKEPQIVCEIGGGYGALARLWLQNSVFHPRCYIDIDFPESLFFAEVFLSVNLHDLKILYVTSPDKLDPCVVSDYSVIFCPVNFVSALSNLSLDLVINTGSLQEMTEEWVDFWMQWLNTQDCRWFYSLNYFFQPLDLMGEGSNSWSPRLTKEWTVRLQIFNPPIVRVHGIYHREFAEILAQKQTTVPSTNSENIKFQYQRTKDKILTGHVMLEAMDIIRLYPDQDLIWDLLLRCTTETPRVPKEAWYLAEYLAKNASPDFSMKNGDELRKIRQKLQSMRSSG